MEQLKGLKVNGTSYALNISDLETHITSPQGKDFTLKVDEKGGVYGYKSGVNESFPYTGGGSGSVSTNEIGLYDYNDSSRSYVATIEDGTFKVTENIGKTLSNNTISGTTTQDPIAQQTLPLVINEIYVNDNAESIANPKHTTKLPVSHNFIEIASYDSENTIDLSNVYLQYFNNTTKKWDVLKLKGHIKPFSTYLVRGAQIAPENAPSTIIDVSTFDIEWKDSTTNALKAFSNTSGAFYLTLDSTPYNESSDASLIGSTANPALKISDSSIPANYIDLVGWGTSDAKEAKAFTNVADNIMIVRRNMLDKTTQANPKDVTKRTNDSGKLKYLDAVYVDRTYLGNEASYRPMASFENKNLYTTRSDFRENRPYCVTVTFGTDATTTRCFNWVSPGNKDEYLFYRPKGTSTWIIKESYDENDGQDASLRNSHYVDGVYQDTSIYMPCYDRLHWETSGGRFLTTHKVIIKNNVTTDINGDVTPLASGLTYYTNNTLNTASGSATDYTKGKEYEYCVGPAETDKYGTVTGPKEGECSDIYYFQVRAKVTNKPWSYIEHSDEQGFHPSEYEVWRRVANIMRAQFNPQFTINAGDMTQSGNRMNEWIDYNTGIEALSQGKDFSVRLEGTTSNPKDASLYTNKSAGVEQMNVVGNNDLAPILDYVMSTGNDAKTDSANARKGKCSPHQFNYFYCYEIDPDNVPAIYNEGKTEIKYIIPSCYSFNYNNCHFTAICSEITSTYASVVYGDVKNKQNTYDIIENWIQRDLDKWYMFSLGNISKATKTGLYPWNICYMHEMPFTILTQKLAAISYTGERTGGCKLNDNATKQFGIAELFQRNHVRLVMGGHKHTESHSWPLLENVIYKDGEGTVEWGHSWELTDASINAGIRTITGLSTKPYVIIPKDASTTDAVKNLISSYKKGTATATKDGDITFAGRISKNCVLCIDNKDITTAPVYVMSQSAGNKVISNSDIPTASIPWLKYYFPGNEISTETVADANTNGNQAYPHFIEYKFNPNASNSSYDYAGNIEVRHYAVNKDAFCNFQTSQVFYNANASKDGQLEFTDPFATKSKMVDIQNKEMSDSLADTIKWTSDFNLDFSEVK